MICPTSVIQLSTILSERCGGRWVSGIESPDTVGSDSNCLVADDRSTSLASSSAGNVNS